LLVVFIQIEVQGLVPLLKPRLYATAGYRNDLQMSVAANDNREQDPQTQKCRRQFEKTALGRRKKARPWSV